MSDQDESRPQGIKLDRSFVSLTVGSLVCCQKEIFRITQVLDFQSVMGINVETGRAKLLQMADLKPVLAEKVKGAYINHDLEDITSEEWATAQMRYSVIAPLLVGVKLDKGAVEARAKEAGINATTIYRWIKRYKDYREVTALIPMKRGWAKGRVRVTDNVEELIGEVINEFHLTSQRPTLTATYEEVKDRCKALKFDHPTLKTVRARIMQISDKELLRGRGYKELADNKHSARPGSLEAEYPLKIVQIDHTPTNVMIVDDVHRKPIGRPWLTLAICVHSRMITGYFLSMNAPSAVSVAMCLVHSILPKERWLALHGVEAKWPVWGKPVTVHSDNGPDFKARSLVQSCINHDIKREFRPVKTPHWGGHIERLLGTFSLLDKKDKGTTFSNPTERKGYDSEKEAIYTFEEFETRLVRNIIKYNNAFHFEISMAPLRKWNLAFFGDQENAPVVPLPPRVSDPWAFQLDFLPSARRVVHHYGVEWDAMYYAEALRPWIGVSDPETGNAKQCLFRRDPRDINRIWFYDPVLKEYFEVPITHAKYQGTTVAEYVAAKKKARKQGMDTVDEETIDRMLEENRLQEIEAAAKTKEARRKAQKRTNNAKGVTPARPERHIPPAKAPSAPPTPEASGLLAEDDVDTFGDVF